MSHDFESHEGQKEELADMCVERWTVESDEWGKLIFSYLCYSTMTQGMRVMFGSVNGFYSGRAPTGCESCELNLKALWGILSTGEEEEEFYASLTHEDDCILKDFSIDSQPHPSAFGTVTDVFLEPVLMAGDVE